MKSIVKILFMILAITLFAACTKSGCDDCLYQKQEFCKAIAEVNCNSAYLTNNIEQLTRACGSSDATSFISTTTQNCTQGTLTCPQCE
jgi:hypothetical protein